MVRQGTVCEVVLSMMSLLVGVVERTHQSQQRSEGNLCGSDKARKAKEVMRKD